MRQRVLLLLALAGACVANKYDESCDTLIQWAEVTGRMYNSGDRAGAKRATAKVEKAYKEAVALEPAQPQAHISYATFLLNSQKFKQSIEVWREALAKMPAEVVKSNPALPAFIEAQIVRSKYGFWSVKKDKVYRNGQGNVSETIRLQGKQIEAYPAPQLFHDRSTVRVMASETDPSQEALAVADFESAQLSAARGWTAGQRQMGVPCVDADSAVAHDLSARAGVTVRLSRPESDAQYGGDVMFYAPEGNVSMDMRFVEEKGSVQVLEMVQGGTLSGDDGVVLSPDSACESRKWTFERVTAELAAFYTKIGDSQKAQTAAQIARAYGSAERLGRALKERYGERAEGTFVEEWREEETRFEKGFCDCFAYPGSQRHRVNLASNLQLLDVYGQSPDERGNQRWYSATVPPKFPPFRGAGAPGGPPPLPRVAVAATVVQFAGSQFYHWVAEALGRVLLLEDLLAEEPEMKVIIPQDTSRNKFIDTSLDMLPFTLPADRVVKYATGGGPPHPRIAADRLIVPTWRSARRVADTPSKEPTAAPPASVLRSIRLALAPKVEGRRKVLWLKRPKSVEMRQLQSESELFDALRSRVAGLGYDAERFEKPPSLKAAAEMFASAAMVVGVHGGAFANIVFCQEGTKVIELGFRTPWSHDYVHMSQALGFDHRVVQLARDDRGMANHEVSVVDVEFVAALAAEMLSEAPVASRSRDEL